MSEGIIRALPPEVIGQIAAGEVVERPASAIKELVENAIDAGASAITVDIRDGGLSSFRVTDNGSGIRPADIKMAFARHATSKIRSADDLYGVRSLGFRGEALASIAAVAKVTCLSRFKGNEFGVEAVNEGGEFTSIREAACPEGTSFTVRELFFNAPVRRKFLKKASVEATQVSDLMERMILSRPDISFRFVMDGKNVYFSPGDGNLDHACLAVFGLHTLKLMTKVHGTQSGVLLHGLVGTGDASRGNRGREYFFLNHRAMRSQALSAAVEEACRQLVMIGRFPICVLHLDVPYENVDVNVHPNKWEVRFSDEAQVRAAVEAIVSDALTATTRTEERIPPVFVPPKNALPERAPAQVVRSEVLPPAAETPVQAPGGAMLAAEPAAVLRMTEPPAQIVSPIFTAPIQNVMPGAAAEAEIRAEQTEDALVRETFREKPLRIIGVAFKTYILIEYDDRLLLCDQHAVHERLLYEKLTKETDGEPPIQALLTPMLVRLTRGEYEAFLNNQEALYRAGFDGEDFGDMTVKLRGLPLILGEPQAEKCFREALDELSANGSISQLERVQRITQMSCKHAVKGGEALPPDALTELVRRMLREDIRLTCPHGRPLMIELTKTDLDKRFKRIQPREQA